MSSNFLSGTPLGTLYTVFGVNGDKELVARMTTIGIVYTIVVGLYSVFKPSPYGRYAQTTFGPAVNAKIGWIVQECMSFIFPVIIMICTPSLQLKNWTNIIALSLFMFHYFQRSFIYPLTMSNKAKPAPIAIILAAIIFTTFNGLLQGHHLANVVTVNDSFHQYTIIGTSMFLIGMGINISHDQMLVSLRKNSPRRKDSSPDSKESTTTHKYQIPRGGLFEYISGANYFGEIIEWIGFAIITREYPQIMFAVFTATFLGIRAVHHHQFYKETFGQAYPKSRKGIVPFVL